MKKHKYYYLDLKDFEIIKSENNSKIEEEIEEIK